MPRHTHLEDLTYFGLTILPLQLFTHGMRLAARLYHHTSIMANMRVQNIRNLYNLENNLRNQGNDSRFWTVETMILCDTEIT